MVTARPSLLERRPHWGEGLDSHALLRLGPLSSRDTVKLVGEIMQRADEVPDAITDLVASTSEGNPFFMEELVKWLVGEGVVDTSTERWSVRARRSTSPGCQRRSKGSSRHASTPSPPTNGPPRSERRWWAASSGTAR